MDPIAQLALMTKAKLVFESPGTFLSFPALSPLTYSVDQLRFATDGAMTAQDLAELGEFARITNTMPSGVIAPTTSGELLWEVCGEVLQTAELATGTMSAEDQARYDAAIAYLYVPSATGAMHREDGPALRAYRQCRDAYIKAQEDYKTRQLTAESADDPAVAAQWAVDEPRLRGVITELEAAWATTGCRDQVEAAQQVELALGARSPVRLWTEWRNALVDVIDMTTDTSQNEFAMTAFAPSDVFDGGAWPSFTLSGKEISALVAQAPPELAAIFGTATAASDIESISFEYRSVSLVRPWLPRAMFQSRFWRLTPEGGELSDGAEPPTGRCPSYVAALVFVRNIVVKRRAQPAEPVRGGRIRDFMVLRPELIRRVPTAVVRDHRSSARAAVVRDHRSSAGVAVVRDHRSSAGAGVRDHRTAGGVVVRDHRGSRHRIRPVLQGQVFTEATTPVTPEPVTAPTTDITILAFICKRTPRCPDPDKSLEWTFSIP